MVITTNTILRWCGITTNANKNTIVAELLCSTEGLGHLNDDTKEGMIATFRDFGRRDANDGKIIFSRVQVQLETATQWDRWIVELKRNLKMIIGSKGIALSMSKYYKDFVRIGTSRDR